MKIHVHYEAAFEDLLRSRQIPYVSVDEARSRRAAKSTTKAKAAGEAARDAEERTERERPARKRKSA